MRRLKKNLESERISKPDAQLLFFDEARFGTHSKLGHGWFPKGSRTAVKIALGFQNFYLYSAVNPKDGKDFTLLMPYVNTACMNKFLEELSCHLGGKEAIIVMDGAGWHKANDLKVPSNIKILYLPPYSPELNPVERLWGYIKQHTIRNKIYATIQILEDAISEFIRNLNQDTVASVCHCRYL